MNKAHALITKISIFLLIVVFVLSFAGCGTLTTGDLIGTWSGSWDFNGATINNTIEFDIDGTYKEISYHNNELSDIKTGTYVIDGNKVSTTHIHTNPNNGYKTPVTITYKYRGGKLRNSGHYLSKIN